MSITTSGGFPFYLTSLWLKMFQFASDNGVVIVAAAGNKTLNLPDDLEIRPATRTPGVLTVGGLDTADNAWITAPGRGSNYGPSVLLWAPGTDIPVAPDPGNAATPAEARAWGTSFASPIVAGVAAMMRFANPSLSAPDIRTLLVETGWHGTDGRVSKGLDAFAAVFAAIHGTLPETGESNDTRATARDLVPSVVHGGALAPNPNGFSTKSLGVDPDWWKFRVDKFSTVTVAVDWYQRLSSLYVGIEGDQPDVRGADELTKVGSPQGGQYVLSGLLSPGTYRIRVGGEGLTAYQLLVTTHPAALPVDEFENNDSFARAAHLLFEFTKWTARTLRTWGPGAYDATLHKERVVSPLTGRTELVMNDDYFRLDVPATALSQRPTVAVYDSDQPLNVTLYDAAQAVIQSRTDVRNMVAHPPESTTCFLKVSGNEPTRYRISTQMSVNKRGIPRLPQEEFDVLPKWWGDPPPFRLKETVTHYVVEVNEARGDGEAIAFERTNEAVRLELLNLSGDVVREAEAVNGHLSIDTRDIQRGSYLLRASKAENTTESFVQLRLVPPLG